MTPLSNLRCAVGGVLAILALAGCSNRNVAVEEEPTTTAWLNRLMLRVQTRAIEPDTVELIGTITNHARNTRYLQYSGHCTALSVQVHRQPNRTDPPVWDSRLRTDPFTGRYIACFDTGAMAELAPGDSLVGRGFGIRLTPADLLGDSLPAGVYYLTAVLEFGMSFRPYVEPQPALVYLLAGSVRLRR